MDTTNLEDQVQEPELEPVVCPRCANEVSDEPWPEACPRCGKRLDLPAQFAYCRGHNAFTVGQELLIRITPKKRRKSLNTKEEMEGVQYYRQAYSSLQVAFQGELAESQRQLGIRIFAAMAMIFQQHAMISPLEFAYWSNLLKELNTQSEQATLKEKLANQNQGGLVGLVQRLRWRRRMKRLDKLLIELDARIRYIEQNIEFVERPRIRRRSGPVNL